MKRVRNFAHKVTNAESSATMLSIIGILLGVIPLLSDASLWWRIPMYIVAVATIFYAIGTFIARSSSLDGLCKNRWKSYHVSHSRSGDDYRWIEGEIKFSDGSGPWNLRGTHEDRVSPYNKYQIKGMMKNGNLILIEQNTENMRIDDCFAYFPSLNNVGSSVEQEDFICGFWFGPDHRNCLTVAPYVLARKAMTLSELNGTVAKLKITIKREANDFAKDISDKSILSA